MNSQQTLLSQGFQPGQYDILIGRGKKCRDHIGNKILLMLVASKLNEYSNAKNKNEKSKILALIVSQIEKKNPYGGFIKKDPKTGLWFRVGESLAREKISQSFRDALHNKYRSSTVSRKRARTNKQKKQSNSKTKKTQAAIQNQQFDQQQEVLSESSTNMWNLESSSIESQLFHKRRHVTAFDNTQIKDCLLSNISILGLSNHEIDNEYCIDLPVIKTDDKDCIDLLSTCNTLIFDEEAIEFEVCNRNDKILATDLLFQGKLFHNERIHQLQ